MLGMAHDVRRNHHFSAAYNQVDAICAKEMDEIAKCRAKCDQSSYEAKTKYYSQIGMYKQNVVMSTFE